MKNLKEQLIRLGSTRPELQKHIRPVLNQLDKTSFSWSNPKEIAGRLGGYLEMQGQDLLNMSNENELKKTIDTIIQKLEKTKRSL